MRAFKDRYGQTVKFKDDAKLRDEVIDKLVAWFAENGVFGESIAQSDRGWENATPFLAELADETFAFETYDP